MNPFAYLLGSSDGPSNPIGGLLRLRRGGGFEAYEEG